MIDNSTNFNDQILLKELHEGKENAFESLFNKYWEFAFSLAYKRLKNKDECKDIVQEIFAHIWTNRQSVHIQNLPAYIHIAVRNKVFKTLARQSKSHSFFHLSDNSAIEFTGADGRLLWKEFIASYEALIKSLPLKRQLIFRHRFHDNLTTSDIAESLGISRKTVQNQIGKALETLKMSLVNPVCFLFLYVFSAT